MNKVNRNIVLKIVLSLALASFLIHYAGREKIEFENLALGSETRTYFGKDRAHHPIHIAGMRSISSFDTFMSGWKKRGSRKVILFLGNSQAHSINHLKPGQATASKLLFDTYDSLGFDVLSVSMPNANFQEFYLLFSYLKSCLSINGLVIPAFFDDFREDGIRESYFAPLAIRYTGFRLEATDDVSSSINESLESFRKNSSDSIADIGALDMTVQKSVEIWLDKAVTGIFPLWGKRDQLRGKFFLALYSLRNSAFGIDAQTPRKRVISSFNRNMTAMKLLVEKAKSAGIDILLFIPPLRGDVKVPYVESEYVEFKNSVKNLAREEGIRFRDMSDLIPGELWGMLRTAANPEHKEYDFMHFRYEGHILLYEELKTVIDSVRTAHAF